MKSFSPQRERFEFQNENKKHSLSRDEADFKMGKKKKKQKKWKKFKKARKQKLEEIDPKTEKNPETKVQFKEEKP